VKLSERLQAAQPGHTPPPPTIPATAVLGGLADSPSGDPLEALRFRLADELFLRLGGRLATGEISDRELQAVVRAELGRIVEEDGSPLTIAERSALIDQVTDNVMGYGPLEAFLSDPTVSEIMVSGTEPIYVERDGRLVETHARFFTEVHLRQVVQRIVSSVGRRIDESSPMVDARLPDGSRVNAVLPPLAVDGPALTIRKFSDTPLQVSDLVEFGTFTADVAALLEQCVKGKLNILISGGTGTGKTTLLNVLSAFIPSDERIVTVEDAVELQLRQRHVVRLEARPANTEGRGEVAIRDLVRNTLRMRPDRIIVGEVRAGETLDMLQAMNTGHDGSLSTVHANSPRDAIARLETMVLMAGVDLPVRAIREQIASALHLIVQVSRLRDGSRRVTHITEVVGMEGDVVTLQDIFTFDFSAGVDGAGRFTGTVRPTGLRPTFSDHLADRGLPVPPSLFGGSPGGVW
jgi:pilus assembly protein CpaF